MTPDGSFEDFGHVPAPDVFNYLCQYCTSVTLDRRNCALKFHFTDLDFFNRFIKEHISCRLREPYTYFVNYFNEVTLDLPLNSLLRHMMHTDGTRIGNCREYTNRLKLDYETQKKTRLQEEH